MTAPQHGNTADEEEAAPLRPPHLPTLAALAAALGRTLAELVELVTGEDRYTGGAVRSRHGWRPITIPVPRLAQAQRWILEHVLLALPIHPAAHGYVSGRSTLTATAPHCGAPCLVTLDLAAWFPSITRTQVEAVLTDVCHYSAEVSWALAGLLTHGGALPQGPCTSPAVSNAVAAPLDATIAAEAARLGATYTRYADDLILSGPAAPTVSMIPLVNRAARILGWRTNEAKTRIAHTGHDRMVALGLDLSGPAPRILRAERGRLRAVEHQARTSGDPLSPRDAGRLAHGRSVEATAKRGAK